MISNKILLICLAFIALTACSAGSKKQTNHHMENEKRTLVKLETTMTIIFRTVDINSRIFHTIKIQKSLAN